MTSSLWLKPILSVLMLNFDNHLKLENEYEITSDFFKSKATNSPYIGKKVYGRIEKTYYKGEAVYER